MRHILKSAKIISFSLALLFSGNSCASWPGLVAYYYTMMGKTEESSMALLALLGLAKSLEKVEVTTTSGGAATVAKGYALPLTATAIYSDGSKQNITSRASWSSSNTQIITSVTAGSASSVGATATGISTVTANFQGKSGLLDITVTNAVLVSIEVTPPSSTLPSGFNMQLTATGLFSDNSLLDITSSSAWTSSSTNMTVGASNGLVNNTATPETTGTYTMTASKDGKNGTASVTASTATLLAVGVSPTSATLSHNTSPAFYSTRQLTATAIFSDGSTIDVTDLAAWSPASSSVATVDNTTSKGFVTTTGTGSQIITATYSATSGTSSITVQTCTLTGVTVTPTNHIAYGTTQQYTATANYSDCPSQDVTASVTWSSTVPTVATVSNGAGTEGLASSVASGSTNIQADFGDQTGSAALTVNIVNLVSLTITPTDPTVDLGNPEQFTVSGTYSNSDIQDLTTQAVWSSSNPSVATISNAAGSQGRVTTVGAGTTTITAVRNGVTGTTSLTVTADTTRPNIISVSAYDAVNKQFVVTFDEAVDPAAATTKANWKVADTLSAGTCGANTLFSSASNSADLDLVAGPFTSIKALSTSQYLLTLDDSGNGATGVASKTYYVYANFANIKDLASSPNFLDCSGSSGSFVGLDTTRPYVSSATASTATTVTVVFNEDMKTAAAGDAANWIIADDATKGTGTCAGGDNFSGATQTGDFTISSVSVTDAKTYVLNLSASTQSKQYYVMLDQAANTIEDLAGNDIGCPNNKSFLGIDGIKPYVVNAISTAPDKIIVNFSEGMKTGTLGTNDAEVASNYTITEADTSTNNATCTDPGTITSVTKISDSSYQLNLGWTQCSIKYKVTVASTVTDIAGNVMGSPAFANFTGVEQIYVVSAQSLSTTTVKVTFSKPVLSSSASCSGKLDCDTKYKFNTLALGDITLATVGTGGETNTVVLTHATDQLGFAYTVIVANAVNGDGFDNGEFTTPVSIRNSGDTENIQKAPRDRASFVGAGTIIDDFSDGAYYNDPFVDGTKFSFAFDYDNKVYLGTNDANSAAFRFEPGGSNATLVTFDFTLLSTASCGKNMLTFGVSGGSCVDGPTGTLGPNSEQGVVGFNKVKHTISGADYELLYTGVLVPNAKYIYYTQDKGTVLQWKNLTFSATGGGNTQSVQSIYGWNNKVYHGLSSDHGTQAPILIQSTASQVSGVVSIATPGDMSLRTLAYIGKGGSPVNPAKDNDAGAVVGIDSMLYVPSTSATVSANRMFVANNGALMYSTTTPPTSDAHFSLAFSLRPDERANTTLTLPVSADGGLGKVSPGQKGVPYIVLFNDTLYMARNIALADICTDPTGDSAGGDGLTTRCEQTVQNGGELWKCKASCESAANWKKVATALNFTGGSENKAISLLAVNKDHLYIGFDNDAGGTTPGVTVFRSKAGLTEVDSGVNTYGANTTADDGDGHLEFEQQGTSGFGESYSIIFSFASVTDGFYDYLYLLVGDGASAIRVFRQIDQ